MGAETHHARAISVFALSDARSPYAPPPAAAPVLVGMVVLGIGTAMGSYHLQGISNTTETLGLTENETNSFLNLTHSFPNLMRK